MEDEDESPKEVTRADGGMLVLQWALSTPKSEKDEQRKTSFIPDVLFREKFAL